MTLGFHYDRQMFKQIKHEQVKSFSIVEQLADSKAQSLTLRPCSNVFKQKEAFTQFYQMCVESNIGSSGYSYFTLKEYQVWWPINSKKSLKKHMIKLVANRVFVPNEKRPNELFVPSLDNLFKIDGTKFSYAIDSPSPSEVIVSRT